MLLLLLPSCYAHSAQPSPAEWLHLQQLREKAAAASPTINAAEAPDYTCSDGVKSTAETWKVSGTSLGGWLVLEPWLTPSLFYQFLGADERYGPDLDNIRLKTGMDQKSFCTALGPKEANRQLRRHWKLWVTEEHIQLIAKTGSTHVRIPVGDWMWEPYDIYDEVEHGVRCNDGAIEELNRALKLIEKYGMKALLDMHAWIGSQNGLDNSGETKFVKWAQEIPEQGTYAPIGTFEHWAYKGWDWIVNSSADWGIAMQLINKGHYSHSMRVIKKVVAQYSKNTAIWGLSPVNEVGAWTPMDVLKKFYWEAYGIVRAGAPHWMYVMDSSFRGSEVGRGDFMKGCPNKALDKHPYHAWAPWGRIQSFYDRSCGWGDEHVEVEEEVDFPVIAGEWSLAMDTCAMWLLGFNDMQPGEPRAICDMVPCPCTGHNDNAIADTGKSTMDSCYLAGEDDDGSFDHPGLPLDPDEGLRGPFGSGISGPMFGRCPREMAMNKVEDEYTTNLAHKQVSVAVILSLLLLPCPLTLALSPPQIAAFNRGHGWFFWNFRTELEPHWDFLEAYDRGWFPRNVSDYKALEKLDVCGDEPPNLQPTATNTVTHGGIYGGVVEKPWLVHNWLPLTVGVVGGLVIAGVAIYVNGKMGAPPTTEPTPYVAMPGGRA